MRADVEKRLAAVHAEIEAAQRVLIEIESQEVHLRKNLLRLSGAAQVLEELLAGDAAAAEAAPPPRVSGIPARGVAGPLAGA